MVRNTVVINNPIHRQIIKSLDKLKSKGSQKERLWVQKYLGSNKPTRCIKGGEIIKLARKIVKENNPDIKQFISLIDSLYSNATTFEEMDIAARLLNVTPKLKVQIDPTKLDLWLNYTHGWAEVDGLCQSNFLPEELLDNWPVWEKLLIKFSKDKNIHKRRASLVLLTKSVRHSPDKRLANLAFKNINRLKKEKEILITKAVSWILRSLIKYHRSEVENYLKKNKNVLPKIAIREVTNKLLTGKKSLTVRH